MSSPSPLARAFRPRKRSAVSPARSTPGSPSSPSTALATQTETWRRPGWRSNRDGARARYGLSSALRALYVPALPTQPHSVLTLCLSNGPALPGKVSRPDRPRRLDALLPAQHSQPSAGVQALCAVDAYDPATCILPEELRERPGQKYHS
jgi:hypothetical protein